MKTRYFLGVCMLMSLLLSHTELFASTGVPRDSLLLEIPFNSGAFDTSGSNRSITSSGTGPSYLLDSINGMSTARFTGNGGISAISSWSGSASSDFTLSLWVRVKANELPPSTGMILPLSYVPIYGYIGGTNTHYLATIVSTHTHPGVESVSIRLNKEFTCAIGGSNYKPPSLFHKDAINNPNFFVDCTKLSDGRWHLVTMRRLNNVLTMSIDLSEVFRGVKDMNVGRVLSFGYFPYPANTDALIYQMNQDPKLTNAYSYFTGSIALARLYNRYLRDDELSQIFDDGSLLQSDTSAQGNMSVGINSYNSPVLEFTVKNILGYLKRTTVYYQYSLSGGTFVNIDPSMITDISSGSGTTLTYKFQLNLMGVPDGNINLSLRIKNGNTLIPIGTLKFQKIDQTYGITLFEPDTIGSTSKLLKAQASGSGILTMSITRGNICDGTLQFEEYSEMIFTSKSDNFTRICYKAYFPGVDKTIYKLSQPIQGIQGSSGNQSVTSRIFDDYVYWTSSKYPRFLDSANHVLDLLAVNGTSSNGTINGVTLTDINGDGLVDFLYSRTDPVRRAIIVNNGNYTFKIVYKCAMEGMLYYGDCADLTR